MPQDAETQPIIVNDPLPSLFDILVGHYEKTNNPSDARRLAASHAASLIGITASHFDGQSNVSDAEAHAPTSSHDPHSIDRSDARAYVIALVRSAHNVSMEPTSPTMLRRLLNEQTSLPEYVSRFPVLSRTDAEGGFSSFRESASSIESIAARLASEGLIAKVSGGYVPTEAVSKNDGPSSGEAPESGEPSADPLQALIGIAVGGAGLMLATLLSRRS